MTPQTAVVLLNWNGWEDTVECVASLLRSDCDDFVIIVCDNASTDASWSQLCSWLQANLAEGYAVWRQGEAWEQNSSRVVLIQTGANLGFAGGCNVGLRFALQHTRCEYLWLLNNDTVVSPGALRSQAECMQQDRRIGLLGSTLRYYGDADRVQCFGGYGFNFWTARVRALPFASDPKKAPEATQVERHIRYVSGASTFTTRAFVEAVGLLNEQYFLYFEEIDWAVRGRAFRISYCPASVVLHKEGRSIGSAREATRRSATSERWLTRNRILFTRTYFPARVPVTVLWVLLLAGFRLCTGRAALAALLLRGVWNGLRAPVCPVPKLGDAARA